jgi:N-acetylglutamate synthase-like GNAT family acetyltransferase
MRAADLPAVLAILDSVNMLPIAPAAEIPEPEVSTLEIENTFVAEVSGNIVGVASYFVRSASVCETASFAVLPEWRRRGIGALLHRARLREMKGRGAVTVITQTDRPENVRWFVHRFGYREVGQNLKRHAFGDPDLDRWTVLELDLQHARLDP